MVAVPETVLSAPVAELVTGRPIVPVSERRLVAVAVTAMELLRPESDLARLLEGVRHVDLLVASEDVSPDAPSVIGVLDGHRVDIDAVLDAAGEDEAADAEETDQWDEVLAGAARLGLPELHLHRLGLRPPLGPSAVGDLVAALSELVGFDPEPGLYCLAPAPAPGDAGRVAVDRAVQRIAQVYGIPLLRYRCLELTVVEDVAP